MTAEGCREWREQLGAYALGALDARDAAAVRAHLEGCAACRSEAESLGTVGSLLRRADPAHLGQGVRPPAALAERVLASVRHEHRARGRRRLHLGLALAGAAAATVVAIVLAVGGDESGWHPARTVSFSTAPSHLEVTAALEPRTWGTEVHMYVHGARRGALCRVWLLRQDGGRVSAGSFRYRYADRDDAAVLTTALPVRDVRAVALDVGGRRFVGPVPGAGGGKT